MKLNQTDIKLYKLQNPNEEEFNTLLVLLNRLYFLLFRLSNTVSIQLKRWYIFTTNLSTSGVVGDDLKLSFQILRGLKITTFP